MSAAEHPPVSVPHTGDMGDREALAFGRAWPGARDGSTRGHGTFVVTRADAVLAAAVRGPDA